MSTARPQQQARDAGPLMSSSWSSSYFSVRTAPPAGHALTTRACSTRPAFDVTNVRYNGAIHDFAFARRPA
jgi:hypothetical protein